MKNILFGLIVLLSAVGARAQGQWTTKRVTDPMTSKAYTLFMLKGKYLVAPQRASGLAPEMVVRCKPQVRKVHYGWGTTGYVGGKFVKGFFDTRTVVGMPGGYGVFGQPEEAGSYRLDDQKPHVDLWQVATDDSALFFKDVQLDTYLYGHMMPHKDWTKNEATKRLLIEVDEWLGGRVVMEFDVGDSSGVAETCGVVVHKKKPVEK